MSHGCKLFENKVIRLSISDSIDNVSFQCVSPDLYYFSSIQWNY